MRRPACCLLAALLTSGAAARANGGADYRNQDLTDRNFSRLDLRQARFDGATLAGTQFVGSNLEGARFDGAKIGASPKGAASFSSAILRSASFAKAQFGAADLQFADLTCADFSGVDLTAATSGPRPRIDGPWATANRCRTKLVGARLRYEQLPSTVWRFSDLTDATFAGMTPSTVSFEGADLSDTILAGVWLAGFNLRKAKLDRAKLDRADLRGAHLEGATALGATLVETRLDFATLTGARFAPSTPKVDLSGATFGHAVLDGVDLRSAVLRQADLAGASLRCARIDNTQRCADLSGAVLEAGDGRDAATLIGADLSGASLAGAALNGVDFQNAWLLGTVFDGTTMSNTDFTGANLAGASFQKNATLSGVRFYNAALQNARFVGATLTGAGDTGQGVDFSCAHLGGADFTNARVLRAKFLYAVAPPAKPEDCCKQTGPTRYCGTVHSDGSVYGPTLRPRLDRKVICPNGEDAVCAGDQWLVPNWQTSECNPRHETETVWSPPVCGDDHHGTVVNVPDAALLACLQESFLGGRKEPITKEMAKTVKRVRCVGRGIGDLTGLEAFEELVQLDLSDNHVASAGPIEGEKRLQHLQVLKLAGNKVPSLSLAGKKDLKALDISNNPALQTLTGMVSVYLQSVDAANTGLAGGAQLKLGTQEDLFLADLYGNHLTDVGNLSRLTKLTHLYLDRNELVKLEGLDKLACARDTELDFVSLACNPKLNCSAVSFGTCDHGRKLLAASGCGRNDLPECRTSTLTAGLPSCVPSGTTLDRAVYVSVYGGKDGAGCGASAASPCATIAAGIAACKAGGGRCGVLVEHGVYPVGATLELAPGVGLYGGCFFAGAPSAGGPWYSLIEAAPAAQPAVRAAAIQAATTFRGFEVLAGSPTAEGAASVALQAQDSPGLTLADVRLVAGNGARGGNGDPGGKGADGGGGGNVGGRNAGGGAGGSVSGCSNTGGGQGAAPAEARSKGCSEAGCNCPFLGCACHWMSVQGGSSGQPGDTGEWAGGGSGRQGKLGSCPISDPDTGGEGGHGRDASCGGGGRPQADLFGSFRGGVWTPPRGELGGRGGNGGGGGGGGAGGACIVPCGVAICTGSGKFFGQAGGGGGAGGCGGSGGDGGQMGGASLSLVVAGRAPALGGVVVIGGTGGDGGRGGDGAVGGQGGGGGASFSQYVCSPTFHYDDGTGAPGGRGGPGGKGGASGGGAGGNGGPALGAALVGGAAPDFRGVTFYTGRGGQPGGASTGGRPAGGPCNGEDGKPGTAGAAADRHEFAAQTVPAPVRAEAFPKPPPQPAPSQRTETLHIEERPPDKE